MNARTLNLAPRCITKRCKGQAMMEFLIIGAIAMIVLFVAIQLAALGREYMALGELNYQVTRWATDLGNNSIAGQNSPQCSDVQKLIHGESVSPYTAVSKVATGYMGKLAYAGVACQSSPPTGGIAVAMACTGPPSSATSPAVPPYTSGQCATRRAAGTGVQITLTMDTSSVIFLSSSTNPSFLGVPFPKTLSSTHVMLTQ